ncbi:hypothetical protein CCACVL1_28000, partial [Corchorus capsularis]
VWDADGDGIGRVTTELNENFDHSTRM